MDLESALSELGVAHGTAFQDVRRAYLRLLKTRKPEIDPDGFLRLRAAFETVQSLLASLHQAESEALADSPGALVWQDSPAAPAAALDRAPETETSRRPGGPFERFDAGSSEDLPPSPSTSQAGADPEDVAEEDVRALLRRLATAGDDELASASNAASPPVVLSTISAWLARGRPIEAGRCLQRLFAACPAHLIPAELVLATVLSLEEAGAVEEGAELLRAAESWLMTSFRERSAHGLDLGPIWLVIRELAAIDGEFPVELRTAIARAVQAGSLAAAAEDLRRFAKQRPSAADRAGQLIADLPIMRAAYRAILIPPPSPPSWLRKTLRRQQLDRTGKLSWTAVVLLIALLIQALIRLWPDAPARRTEWEATEPVAMPAPVVSSASAGPLAAKSPADGPLSAGAPVAGLSAAGSVDAGSLAAGPAQAGPRSAGSLADGPGLHPRLLYNGLCRPMTPLVAAGSPPCRLATGALAYLDQGLCAEAHLRLVKLDEWIEGHAADPSGPGFYSLSEALHHALPACAQALPPPLFFRVACGGARVPSAECLRAASLIQAARGGDCRLANAVWVQMTGAAALGGGDSADFGHLRRGLEDLIASCR
jgi:hypothetical protein